MSAHINKTCQSVIYHLHNIGRIRKYLSYDDSESIVQAVIMSRIDYCNSLLVGVPAVQLSKLQRLQNAAACLVSNVACMITLLLHLLSYIDSQYGLGSFLRQQC